MIYKNIGSWLKAPYSLMFAIILGSIVLSGCSGQYRSVENNSLFATTLEAYVGDWQGNIDTEPGQTAPIVLHLMKEPDSFTATIDSPYQKAFNMPLTVQVNDEGNLRLVNDELDILFDGELTQEKIKGSLSVRGYDFAINFSRQSQEQLNMLSQLLVKKQTPVAPFDYQSRELNINNKGNILAATLTLPHGEGPFPTVILLSGTGPDDRDYSAHGHKRFLVLADHLTKQGIAVLRFDERGVGESTGDFKTANFDDFVDDVNALIASLKTIKEVDTNKLGLIGHSEGGMIAPMTAAINEEVDFLVLLASMSDQKIGLQLQYEQIAASYGFDKVTFSQAVKSLEKLALTGAKASELVDYYLQHFQAEMPIEQRQLQQTALHFTSPSMISFFSYQPKKYLSQLQMPILSLCGSLDHYFDCTVHTNSMKDIFLAAGNNQFAYKVYPQLNHYLQTAKNGTIAEEANLEETISVQALSDLSQWVLRQL